MKKQIMEMFDHFRISEIAINKDDLPYWEFWNEILGDKPYRMHHNKNIKDVVIMGDGEYPLKGYDLLIEEHLSLFEIIKDSKINCNGVLINNMYYKEGAPVLE